MNNKKIIIDYDEYQNLLKTIKGQEDYIKKLTVEDKIILLDARYYNICDHLKIPRVIVGEVLAKEYLQKEFDKLEEEFLEWRKEVNEERRKEMLNMDKLKKELNKKKWNIFCK